NLALRLANDPRLLRSFRERLDRNRLAYPLFDSDRYRRHIEATYVRMWEIWQRGEAPQGFAIEPYHNADPQNSRPGHLARNAPGVRRTRCSARGIRRRPRGGV